MPRKVAANNSSKRNRPTSKAVLLLISELSSNSSKNNSDCHLIDGEMLAHREETREAEVEGYLC